MPWFVSVCCAACVHTPRHKYTHRNPHARTCTRHYTSGGGRAREEVPYRIGRWGLRRVTYAIACFDVVKDGRETCVVGIGAVTKVAITRAIRDGDEAEIGKRVVPHFRS